MIKELLEQLAPLDAQIAALRGGAQDEESQMAAITAHAWRKMRSSAAAAR
jgi:acetyl-CoA carboxylase carboxyl transferase subunit alpha